MLVTAHDALKDARTKRYRLINRAGEQYFGIPRKSMIGKIAEEVFCKEIAESSSSTITSC